MILVVDDIRRLNVEGAIHVTNIAGALRMMSKAVQANEVIEALYLDHDLGSRDIRPLVKILELKPKDLPEIKQIYIHSVNPVGAQWILETLKPYYNTRRLTLGELLKVLR